MKCAMVWGTAAMPVDLEDVEEQIGQIRDDLEPLEAGRATIGEREGNGPWRDHAGHDQDATSSPRTYEPILADTRRE
jgi:hypothetical protein